METSRAKLKAKASQDAAYTVKVTEAQAITTTPEKFISTANDTVAEVELYKGDEAEDHVFKEATTQIEKLIAACETHTDGARRAKSRFAGLLT